MGELFYGFRCSILAFHKDIEISFTLSDILAFLWIKGLVNYGKIWAA